MSPLQELAWRQTELGAVSLRRRRAPGATEWIYEVRLDDDFLMSSSFTAGEIALADVALAYLPPDRPIDAVVGGLGLGFTAHAVLADPRVQHLVVVEALAVVVDWHTQGLVPGGAELIADPRTRVVTGDFFALAAGDNGLDGAGPRTVDAVLIDIDHSPRHVLHPGNAQLYTGAGLRRLARHLRPGGVMALWSNDPPDEDFVAVLRTVFPGGVARVVEFDNPLQGRTATNTVYVGAADPDPDAT